MGVEHIRLAELWAAKARSREGIDEVEFRFRKWLQAHTRAGHDPAIVVGVLEQAIKEAPHGTFWFSRELLARLPALEQPGVEQLPDETADERSRRKAQTEAFLRRGDPVDVETADHLAELEHEQEDVDRMSDGERAELRGLLGRQRGGEEAARG